MCLTSVETAPLKPLKDKRSVSFPPHIIWLVAVQGQFSPDSWQSLLFSEENVRNGAETGFLHSQQLPNTLGYLLTALTLTSWPKTRPWFFLSLHCLPLVWKPWSNKSPQILPHIQVLAVQSHLNLCIVFVVPLFQSLFSIFFRSLESFGRAKTSASSTLFFSWFFKWCVKFDSGFPIAVSFITQWTGHEPASKGLNDANEKKNNYDRFWTQYSFPSLVLLRRLSHFTVLLKKTSTVRIFYKYQMTLYLI